MSGTDDGSVWCAGCGGELDVVSLPRRLVEREVSNVGSRGGVCGYAWQVVDCPQCSTSVRVTVPLWTALPPRDPAVAAGESLPRRPEEGPAAAVDRLRRQRDELLAACDAFSAAGVSAWGFDPSMPDIVVCVGCGLVSSRADEKHMANCTRLAARVVVQRIRREELLDGR